MAGRRAPPSGVPQHLSPLVDLPQVAQLPRERFGDGLDEPRRGFLHARRLGKDARHRVLDGEPPFGLLALRHVGTDAGHPHGPARLIVESLPPGAHPPHDAIWTDDPIVQDVVRPFGHRLLDGLQHAFAVLGMDVADGVLERSPEGARFQAVDLLQVVRPAHPALQDVPVPGPHAARRQGDPEALLAFLQGELGSLPLGHIAFPALDADAPSLLVQERAPRGERPLHGTSFGDQADLLVPDVAAGQQPSPSLLDVLSVLRMDPIEVRAFPDLVRREAGELLDGLVHVEQVLVEVVGQDGDGRVLGDQAEVALGLPELSDALLQLSLHTLAVADVEPCRHHAEWRAALVVER